jgi:hypothetical protein
MMQRQWNWPNRGVLNPKFPHLRGNRTKASFKDEPIEYPGSPFMKQSKNFKELSKAYLPGKFVTLNDRFYSRRRLLINPNTFTKPGEDAEWEHLVYAKRAEAQVKRPVLEKSRVQLEKR